MPDTIILAGGYVLPDRSASAIRAVGMAKLFKSIGFEVIILGKLSSDIPKRGDDWKVDIEGVCCRDIRSPLPGRDFRSYIASADPVAAVIDEVGCENIRAVVAYNYPPRGTAALIRACRVRGIAPVLDCTEWYGWEGRKVIRNVLRILGSEWRMRLLTRQAGNVICASSFLANRVKNCHTLLLPFVVDARNPKWQPAPHADDVAVRPAQLVYCGSPGLGMYKDRLPITVAGLHRLVGEIGCDFVLTIAGMTETEYLEVVPAHRRLLRDLGSRIRFLGRISHDDALNLLASKDFSVFFRRPSRGNNTGFATKYVEATSLGIPVITNDTSDYGCYIRNGHNGFLAPDTSDTAVSDILRRAVTLPPKARTAMKSACAAYNPFDIPHWQDAARDFIQALRKCT